MLNIPFISKKDQLEQEPSQEQRQAEILLFVLEKRLEEKSVTFEELADIHHDATLRTCFQDGFLLNEIDHKTGYSVVRMTETALVFLEEQTA